MQLTQQHQRLLGQRYDMLLAHLHFLGGNAPMGFVAVEIKLRPLRMTQFTGTHEQQRCELQCIGSDHVPGIAVDGSQQLSYASRLRDRRMVLGYHRRQCSFEINGWITLGASRLHGIAKHLRAALAGAMRGFVNTPAFDAFEHLEHIHGAKLGDGTRADIGKHQGLKGPYRLGESGRRQFLLLQRQPFACDRFKGIRGGGFRRGRGILSARSGVAADDLDYVAFYDKPLTKFERLLETYLAYAPRGFRSFSLAMPLWLKDKLHRRQLRAGCPAPTALVWFSSTTTRATPPAPSFPARSRRRPS